MHFLLLLVQVSIATPTSIDQLWAQGREQLRLARYADADRTLRTAVHEAESSGGNATSLGVMLNDLAEACRRMGNYGEAESLYARAIERLRTQPADSRDLVLVLGNQGTMYR